MASQRPYASAMVMRTDSAEAPEGFTIEHRYQQRPVKGCRLALYSGRASLGHASDYQHREAWWLEVDVYGPENRSVKYKCFRFTGKGAEERATKAYAANLESLALLWPGCSASFPTAWALEVA